MSVHNFVSAARHIMNGPLVRPARLKWERQQFLAGEGFGLHFGVFGSFAEARATLPQSPEFDQASLASEYVEVRTKRVFEYDYPVMMWLDRAFRDGATRVLDIGGSVGVHYYGYSRYLEMPAQLSWHVVEVPAIASIGRDLATPNGAAALNFTSDLDEAVPGGNHDVWISAGAIQYFEDAHPAQLLEGCARRPTHILLNKLPLYSGEDYVTTQNIGEGSFAPLHVYNRARFIHSIEELGYTMWDKWDVHERSMHVPGHPDNSFPTFTGLYFMANSVAAMKRRPKDAVNEHIR